MRKKLNRWINSAPMFRRMLNLYPPYLGAGIRIANIDNNYRFLRVEMKLSWFNRNYVRTHFGGSLYSMTDPFYMLLLMKNLGNDFIVWDLKAEIEYLRPGKGIVGADFQLTPEMLENIRKHTKDGNKYCPSYTIEVRDEAGETVALVKKTIYIRKKPAR